MNALILFALLLGPTPLLFAEEALFTWDPSPDPDIIGYKLYYGTASGQYEESVDIGNTTSLLLSVVKPGTHYFAVTAYKPGPIESGFSNEVSKEMSGDDSFGGGGGGCALRLPLHGERTPLDAAEMLVLIVAIFFLAVKRVFPPLSLRRQRPLHRSD